MKVKKYSLCGALFVFLYMTFCLCVFSQELINEKPLQDFLADLKANGLKNADLTRPFRVQVEIVFTTESGREKTSLRLINSEGDEVQRQLAFNGIRALTDGGYFGSLVPYGIKRQIITFDHLKDQSTFTIQGELDKNKDSKVVAKSLSSFVEVLKSGLDPNLSENEKRELSIIANNSNVKYQREKVVISCSLSQLQLTELISLLTQVSQN
jgi:hypothetical protein